EHEFASSNQTHEEFDRFGLFRQHGRTYTRGGLERSVLGQSCTVDADCDGGACSAEGLCEGGWTPDYGETDFLTFYTPRHNLYRNALTEETCTTDADCMQFADSYCDAAASVCTTPRAERELRTIDYWLNPGFPEYLVQDAMMVVGTWNEPFMQGVRAIQGRPAPDYASIRIRCQSADPTDYCFCGSAEDEGGTCVGRYDPFVSPEQYLGLGVADPYRCSIESGPFIEPPNPVEYAQYAGAYAHRFTGSECRMRLHVNTCDRDPLGDCEELGDIRYQFFNLVPANFGFSGVASPLSDPTNGELITANANMSQISVEQAIETAVEYFPVLRREPGAQERYLSGENLLGYFDRVGRTQHPVALAPTLSGNLSGGDFSDAAGDDSAFPSVPTGDQLAEAVRHKVDEVIDRVQTYQGPEGRAQLFTDRMSRLAGTHLEAQLVGSLGVDGLEAIHQHYDDPSLLPADTSATDDAVLDRVSPFRDNFLPSIFRERNEELDLGQQNWCFHGESLYRSAQWEYWADAFEGVAPAEASIRLQQWMMRQVMFHEIGHSIGLRHNFAASYDRNNYHDAYFNIARSHPLPILDDYDLPENGGNADGFVGGAEITNYYRGLRQVRDTRAALGIENTMSSSAMDYVFAGSMHLGRYDRAAALFSYFGLIEAFEGDPRYLFPDSLNGITQSDIFDRTLWTYYRGGERCQVDRDCPYGPDADSLIEQPLFQRCIQNPRTVEFPTPCEEESRGCICSAIFDDFNDYVGGFAFRPPGSEVDYYPVEYLFCTDERTHDISWCNRFDFGESFQETVENFRRDWEEAYPHEYFRRFRTDGARGFATQNAVIDAVKIYQHFYYRYIYEPEYRTNLGPLGFLDQVL
ncbi:MAG: zinc-dependent metalloprotease, partial [Myxococcota bacterium]